MTSCLVSSIWNPFWKGVYSKRKEFAPNGSKFFPFRVDPFSGRSQKQFWQLPPLKVYPFPFNKEKFDWDGTWEKCHYSIREQRRSWPACAFTQYNQGLRCPSIYSTVPIDSASRKGRPLSDCANVQVDLGLRCLLMREGIFSYENCSRGIYHFTDMQNLRSVVLDCDQFCCTCHRHWSEIGKKSIMDFAVRTWNLTGSENFDEYMKTIGNIVYFINYLYPLICYSQLQQPVWRCFLLLFFFPYFLGENKTWRVMRIVCPAGDSHEIPSLIFSEKWQKRISSALI